MFCVKLYPNLSVCVCRCSLATELLATCHIVRLPWLQKLGIFTHEPKNLKLEKLGIFTYEPKNKQNLTMDVCCCSSGMDPLACCTFCSPR